jgi:hypothetical protein
MSIDMNSISTFLSTITSLPVITLVYLAITILLSAITSYIRTQSYKKLITSNPELLFDDVIIPSLQLVPSHIVFHPWTLLTSPFVETSPFQFLAGLLIIYFGITFLESQWNPKSSDIDSIDDISNYLNSRQPIPETLKFTLFVTIVSNFINLLIVSFIHIINGTTETLNYPLQYGLFILILPLSVVAKQLAPETNIRVLSFFKFRLKRSPFILLSLSFILSLLRISLSPFLPSFVSFFTAWYYLRYIQISPAINANILPTSTSNSNSNSSNANNSSSTRGDPSDTFALVEFFPEILKPTLKPLFDGFYQLSVLLGVVRPWNDDDVDIGNLRSNLRVSGTSSNFSKNSNSGSKSNNNASSTEIDERRRQIALKVLEQTIDDK